MNVTVFLGPSLPLEAAREILPDAVFRGPAAQGDLLSCLRQDHPHVVVLIDGTFHQNLSVWHAEICYLLSEGVYVYGASSMGALRAVETAPFGMVGVGRVYEWYRDGHVTADDEVALLHAPEELAYRPLTEPLVNIRASLDEAVVRNWIDDNVRGQVIDIAKSIHYRDRDLDAILFACANSSLARPCIDATKRALSEAYIDIKRLDACAVLNTVSQLEKSTDHLSRSKFTFRTSGGFDGLYNIERKVRHAETDLPLQSVAEHIALHSLDFEEVRTSSLHRAICLFFANLVDVTISQEEFEAVRNRFISERCLDEDGKLEAWLSTNDLDESDFAEFIKEEAICDRLRDWILGISQFDRGAKQLLDELRRRGIYSYWADRAGEEKKTADLFFCLPEYEHTRTQDAVALAEAYGKRTGVWITGDAARWAEQRGFDSVVALESALRRASVYVDVKDRASGVRLQLQRGGLSCPLATLDPSPEKK